MMGRTRVGRSMDVQRLGSAIKRPGIDTRCWVSLAVATSDIKVDLTEDKEGVFIDVQLMPSEEKLTARVGSEYEGDGFGLYQRIRKDDELVVVVPSGITAEGPVVISRLWSSADKPPELAEQNPEDMVLVVEKDKNLRIALSGKGSVVFDVDDSEDSSGEANFTINVKGGGAVTTNVEGGGDVTTNVKDGGKVVVDVGGNQLVVTDSLIENGKESASDKAAMDSLLQGELTRIQEDLFKLRDEVGRLRFPVTEFIMPLFPGDITQTFKAPLVYTPVKILNIRTGSTPKQGNAAQDKGANQGQFVPDVLRPGESGVLSQPSDPQATNSNLVTIDS